MQLYILVNYSITKIKHINIMKNHKDYWVLIKHHLHLPFPLKNHYYKWHRINIYKSIFCTSCNQFFDISKKHKHPILSEIKCSHCGSNKFYTSTSIFKAWIDKKSTYEIINHYLQIENIKNYTK